MLETHPYGNFVPKNSKYLFLGSFPAKFSPENDWFFSNKRNQFWKIMSEVYTINPDTKPKKQDLFNKLKMAIADIILSCERKDNSNLDVNLDNITINYDGVLAIINKNKIEKIYFSSRFVEKLFKKHFKGVIKEYPGIELITLPSPSPRYAAMSLNEKVLKYKQLLPV